MLLGDWSTAIVRTTRLVRRSMTLTVPRPLGIGKDGKTFEQRSSFTNVLVL